jgi:hypothetical protein
MNKPKRKRTKQPSIRETIADRSPLRRLTVTPVDPYAVPQQDPTPDKSEQETDSTTPGSRDSGSQRAASPSPAANSGAADAKGVSDDLVGVKDDPVVQYGTYIRASQRTGIKLRAAITGRDSYAIIQDAIDEYFENHPVNPVG